ISSVSILRRRIPTLFPYTTLFRSIGRAFVLEAIKRGHRVVFSFRSRDADAAETVKMAAALGGEAVSVKGDLERFEDVDAVIDARSEERRVGKERSSRGGAVRRGER